VRKYARELGVPLDEVKGTGPKGRITQDDVQAFTKAVMAGAHGVQVVSAVLKNGVGVVTRLVEGLDRWLAEAGLDEAAIAALRAKGVVGG